MFFSDVLHFFIYFLSLICHLTQNKFVTRHKIAVIFVTLILNTLTITTKNIYNVKQNILCFLLLCRYYALSLQPVTN